MKLTPNKDGLLHISRMANGRVGQVEDVLNLGDTVKVEVIEIDSKTGKVSLDRLEKPDAPASSGPGRPERSDREPRDRDRRPGRSHREEASSGDSRKPRRRH